MKWKRRKVITQEIGKDVGLVIFYIIQNIILIFIRFYEKKKWEKTTLAFALKRRDEKWKVESEGKGDQLTRRRVRYAIC